MVIMSTAFDLNQLSPEALRVLYRTGQLEFLNQLDNWKLCVEEHTFKTLIHMLPRAPIRLRPGPGEIPVRDGP
jgi:hypothetical protein